MMTFQDLGAINMGKLIRFKDNLLKTKRITKKEYDVITDFLTFIINEEGE